MAGDLLLWARAVNAASDALCALLDGGTLRIYGGVRPSALDPTIGTQPLLALLGFGVPAFGAAVAGMATANALAIDPNAAVTGSATWFRALASDGGVVFDGTVGLEGSGSDIEMKTTAIQAGAEVRVDSLTFAFPQAEEA